LFSFGRSDTGRLGQGQAKGSFQEPKQIEALVGKNVSQISTFSTHSVALSSSGEVYVWGNGQHGRLGTKSTSHQLSPVKLKSLASVHIVMISVGLSHSVFLSDLGQLFTCGSGLNGRLGHGDTKERSEPTPISDFTVLHPLGAKLCCGSSFTFLITAEGALYSWGKNSVGQCGQGHFGECNKPSLVSSLSSEIITDISAGWDHAVCCSRTIHSFVLPDFLERGAVYTWGHGYEGNRPVLGNGTTHKQLSPLAVSKLSSEFISRVGSGYDHCLALTETGEIWAWGSNTTVLACKSLISLYRAN
jgi:alpha-tubulin suppressor-like RCC1 family protein